MLECCILRLRGNADIVFTRLLSGATIEDGGLSKRSDGKGNSKGFFLNSMIYYTGCEDRPWQTHGIYLNMRKERKKSK